MLFKNFTILDENFNLVAKDLIVENGVITQIALPNLLNNSENNAINDFVDGTGLYLLPGLLDEHIHGAVNYDTMDASNEGLDKISRFLAGHGITSFLATTMSMPVTALNKVFDLETNLSGAKLLGYHMEGPFINMNKKGAQNPAYIRNATYEEYKNYHHREKIKLISLAPETEGALKFIRQAGEEVVCQLGHTLADDTTANLAFNYGAKGLCHLFNAMPELMHRAPGTVGAGCLNHTYAEIIADGVHNSPATVYAAYKMFGADHLILVSDAMRAAGLQDGEYDLGGQTVTVSKGVARIANGAIAGGISNIWDNVKRITSYGIPLQDAVRMASLTPATYLGFDNQIGSLKKSKRADFFAVTHDLEIKRVWIDGKEFDF
ncbi:N-acetylglucosamine-6-phosphate deacetylase [Amygdalobacter indicium]|jgi:hypothetical protein|uniref:N-acetylglucosamine-6-phosphate deacetylase n=1 Tax=Amygdalobacter indicium TaxID=3029272 RepID=A0ABY8C3T1_9FIRM|nr:N-acetylglucosamine-6-phosphate deacetylase [Amygdalobacter indicium]WEG35337.1 N-acetylglucosamine-6-phosphate deacetylase [Amygdalobacter indicium]